MKIDKNKSIEQLEGKYYPVVTESTSLVETVTTLRKKKIGDFSIEDLRVCIGQNEGFPYLIPLAIDKLKENILAEGNYYEGDLFANVLTADKAFWLLNHNYWVIVCGLYEKNKLLFESDNMFRQIRKSYGEFRQIHN